MAEKQGYQALVASPISPDWSARFAPGFFLPTFRLQGMTRAQQWPKIEMTTTISIRHPDGHVEDAELTRRGPTGMPGICCIDVRSTERDNITIENDDFFECLTDLRRILESAGAQILCQGARPDVFPSPMMRQSGCKTAYIMRMGRPAATGDVVHIFDPAELEIVGSVAAQEAYHQAWLASFGKSTSSP